MCMSNLPIEFDENGDPYLAEEADDVEQPTCGCEDEVALAELDPESAFEDIADSVPDDVLEHLEAGPDAPDAPDATDAADAPDATDAPDAPDATDAANAPNATDATDAPEVADLADPASPTGGE